MTPSSPDICWRYLQQVGFHTIKSVIIIQEAQAMQARIFSWIFNPILHGSVVIIQEAEAMQARLFSWIFNPIVHGSVVKQSIFAVNCTVKYFI
jgi:hypothetical protein